MQLLTQQQCTLVSGGLTGAELLTGGAALGGGVLSYKIMTYLEPFSTFIGTIGTGIACGTVGFLFGGPIGFVLCGCAGATVGYLASAMMANVGAFALGAVGMGLLVQYNL